MTLPAWFANPSDHPGDDTPHGANRYGSPAARRLQLVRGTASAEPAGSTTSDRDTTADTTLFTQAISGDFVAFETLHRQYYPSLLRFARRFVETKDDAEDVVQQVFMTLWVHRDTVTHDVPVAPYLFGAIRNRALTHRKRFGAPRPSPRSTPSDTIDPASTRTTSDTELRATLDSAIVALPERQRAALLLWWIEELSYADVGRTLGISHVAARKLVVKALERLRPLLDP